MTAIMKHPTMEINGNEYTMLLGLIESTFLGVEDHGIFTYWLTMDYGSSGQSVGQYALDEPRNGSDGEHLGRFGTAAGLDLIMRTLKVVGTDRWEKLKGSRVYVLKEGDDWGYGLGFANVTNPENNYLIFGEHFKQWKLTEPNQ
jgi:hypothetical protein